MWLPWAPGSSPLSRRNRHVHPPPSTRTPGSSWWIWKRIAKRSRHRLAPDLGSRSAPSQCRPLPHPSAVQWRSSLWSLLNWNLEDQGVPTSTYLLYNSDESDPILAALINIVISIGMYSALWDHYRYSLKMFWVIDCSWTANNSQHNKC